MIYLENGLLFLEYYCGKQGISWQPSWPLTFPFLLLFCRRSPVQLDDFEAYLKDMSKDTAYKFSLQFEVRNCQPFQLFFPQLKTQGSGCPFTEKKLSLIFLNLTFPKIT